jgi:hypothetical protein
MLGTHLEFRNHGVSGRGLSSANAVAENIRPAARERWSNRPASEFDGRMVEPQISLQHTRKREQRIGRIVLRAGRPTPPESPLIGRPAHGAPLTSINSPGAPL